MWPTSMVMQPASANASACTGDGPATPALSSVIDAGPLVPERIRLPVQVRSTTVGGLATSGIVACHVQMEPARSRSTQKKPDLSVLCVLPGSFLSRGGAAGDR